MERAHSLEESLELRPSIIQELMQDVSDDADIESGPVADHCTPVSSTNDVAAMQCQQQPVYHNLQTQSTSSQPQQSSIGAGATVMPFGQASGSGASQPASQAYPSFNTGALPPQPEKGRRGRKSLPKLPDLQAQLDSLTRQFDTLNKENGFLRNKLKASMC